MILKKQTNKICLILIFIGLSYSIFNSIFYTKKFDRFFINSQGDETHYLIKNDTYHYWSQAELYKTDIQNESKESPAYKKYFMHGTSHHMGLDTHDYGLLDDPMKENMVFTVEPGIYLPNEGFGIRLEDDVVIQQTGEPINLMRNIPIEVDEIEHLMNL